MHRGSRISTLLLAATLLASAGSGAFAQSNAVVPPPPPQEGTVGPEQLRDFSLGGQKEEQAQPGPQVSSPQQQAPVGPSAVAPMTERQPVAPAIGQSTPTQAAQSRPVANTGSTPIAQAPGAQVGTSATAAEAAAEQISDGLPPATPAPVSSFDFGSSSLPSVPGVDTAPLTATGDGAPLWPWLLALVAAIAGGLFLLQRRRSAGQAKLDGRALAFAGGSPAPVPHPVPAPRPVPPPPAAAPRPAPVPAPAAPPAAPVASHPKGVGIVSTRLRPWLDIDVAITAAVLTEEDLQLHLQLIVSNSGSTPARQVGVEVVALNAGAEQERELAEYFGRPDPDPRAADMIAPLDQVVLQSVVRMPRSAFREYAAGGGRVLVPIVALNASYRAGSNAGRTSMSFLIGRGSSESEKLGPLRTDQGSRQFSGVIARPINLGVRR